MSAGGLHQRLPAGGEVLERDLAEVERLSRARHHDRVNLMIRFGQRRLQRRLDRSAHENGLGARVLEHVGEVVGGEQGVHSNRNDARQHRAQEGDRPVSAVLHQDEHALLALDAALLEGRGEPSGALVQLPVGHRPGVVDERRLARPPGVRAQKVSREVERLWRRLNGAHAHRRLLNSLAARAERRAKACLPRFDAILCFMSS